MTDRELMQQALDALDNTRTTCNESFHAAASGALRARLAQPEHEPVGRFAKFSDGIWKEVTDGSAGQPLYTAPPQRKPLTDEQIMKLCSAQWLSHPIEVARAIETAHGIKEKNT